MNDKQLQTLINKTISLRIKYNDILNRLENEYIRRFNVNPSDVDDNLFIDTFHTQQNNKLTVKEFIKSAKHSIKLNK